MIPIIFLMQKQQSVCDYTTRWSYVTSLMMMLMIENLLGLKRCLHVYEGSRMVKPKGRVMTSEKKERKTAWTSWECTYSYVICFFPVRCAYTMQLSPLQLHANENWGRHVATAEQWNG